jgi:hypothetical protein
VLQEGPRAHDLVLVGIIKAYSGTQPDIVMESISLLRKPSVSLSASGFP